MSFEYKNLIQGHGKGGSRDSVRFPVDDPEGVLYQTDISGNAITYAVSQNHIEVLDLISEGMIDGLVSGYWTKSGNVGDIGYASSVFSSYSTPSGLSDTTSWLRSVYWNQTQLIDSNGQFNFQNIDVSYTKGYPNGAILNTTNSDLIVVRPIGERLRGAPTTETNTILNSNSDFAKVYSFYNKDVKQLKINIRVNQLSKTNTTKEEYGDTEKTKISYSIYKKKLFSTPGKIDNYVLAATDFIEGKVTYGFIKTTNITLATASDDSVNQNDFIGWQIRIIRTTPETYETTVRNQTFIDSIVEISGDTFSYPNSAIVRQKFNAEYFSQIPSRSFHVRGLKVLVPSNYDVDSKTYSGDWDGTFKDDKEWTDNPAWCYFDLLTNKRYGLGNYLDTDSIDKWTLYEISRYCDMLVPDGFGGVEPRLTCNLIISSREEAFKVVADLASIFRGITYYSGGIIQASYDSPKSPTFQFTNANVENGEFQYSSSAKKARHTVAIVRYNDKNNFYQPAIEYVEDQEGIKRYGVREIETSAFGCTSRGQAIRFGRWILLSERLETESVTFTTDLQATLLRPGDVFSVSDQYQNYQRYGGRTYQVVNGASTSTVTLDAQLDLGSTKLYEFNLTTPTYDYDTTQTTLTSSAETVGINRPQYQTKTFFGSAASTSNNRTQISFTTPFNFTDYTSGTQMTWGINLVTGASTGPEDYETASGLAKLYRVINIQETEKNKFSIGGLQYEYAKYAQIDSGLALDQPTTLYRSQPQAPSALFLSLEQRTTNTKAINYSFVVPNLSGITNYLVYAKQNAFGAGDVNTNNLISVLPYNVTTGVYIPSSEGNYYFRVYSNNTFAGASSSYAANNIIVTNTNPLLDLTISSLRLDTDDGTNSGGTTYTGTYTNSSPTFSWQVGFNAASIAPSDFTYRVTVRKPSASNTPDPGIWYSVSGYYPSDPTNLTYQFPIATNVAATNGPFRSYDLVVEATKLDGSSSAGGNFINMVNASGLQDSLYTNPLGYDIMYVTNPPPTGIRLTPDGESQSASLLAGTTYTNQWLNTDGSTVIKFNTGTIQFSDLVGGFVYTNPTGYFTDISVPGVSRTKFAFPTTENVVFPFAVSIPTQITNTGTWVALSLYDQFDDGHLTEQTISGLYLSNTTYIQKLGDFTAASGNLQNQISVLQSGIFNGNIYVNGTGYITKIIGGGDNCAPGVFAGVLGGSGNCAVGNYSMVGGGIDNRATGIFSSIPGGSGNRTNGTYSMAFGAKAYASDNGSLVFGDGTTTSVKQSAGSNTASFHYEGGVFITGNGNLNVQKNVVVNGGVFSTGIVVTDPLGNLNRDTKIFGEDSGGYYQVKARISGVDYVLFTKAI